MLPSKLRLSRLEFDKVKSLGKLYSSKHFGLLVAREGFAADQKFGFVISKKIAKRAVDRNKTKRQLRKLVVNNLAFIQNGVALLFLAKKTILKASESELTEEFDKVLKMANLQK